MIFYSHKRFNTLIIMDLSAIRKLSEKRAGGMRKLASDIGMSEANLHRCVNNNKIQAADLEKIAILLNVDICVFFEEKVHKQSNNATANNGSIAFSGDNNSGNVGCESSKLYEERIKHLEDLLVEKERLIKVYEKMMEK